MKSSNDGISKTWTVEKSHLPFYSGGKIEIFNQENDLMTLYQNKTIKIIDISNGHNMPITTMSYDSTGTLVATGSTDRSVRVWDITKGHCTHKFNEHADIIRLVQFHSNSSITNTTSTLYSTSDDNTIKIWDLITSACIATFNDHISSPKAIGFSPDGYMLLSTGLDKVINFYELRDYSLIKLFPVMEEIHGLIVLSNEHSNSLLGENSLKIGDMQFVIVVSDGHIDIVLAADVTPDGKYLLTCSKDKTCRIWDLTTLSNIAIGSEMADEL
eukprot:gene20949-27152_t